MNDELNTGAGSDERCLGQMPFQLIIPRSSFIISEPSFYTQDEWFDSPAFACATIGANGARDFNQTFRGGASRPLQR